MKEVCRTCLAETNATIFKTIILDQEEFALVDMLNDCTGIKVTKDDEISLNICDVCIEDIIKSYIYRKKCWDSQTYLLDQLEDLASNKLNKKPIKIEIDSDNEDYDAVESESSSADGTYFKDDVSNPDDIIPNETDANTYYEYLDESQKSKAKGAVICNLCQKIYSRRDIMLAHLQKVHKINVYHKFGCTQCKKSFRKMASLQQHIANIHEQPQPVNEMKKFMCDYCGLKLKNRQNFVTHLRRHTGEKPYKCKLCDYRSVQSTSINMHMRTHTGERPFKCDLCAKQFRTSSSRAAHRRVHSEETPYECIVCSKKFKKKDIYKEHMVIHDPDKHIECKFCGKKFARKDNLKTHIKQHTGEKPHVCECCGKGFIQKHCWRNHMKNHHNK